METERRDHQGCYLLVLVMMGEDITQVRLEK